MLKKGFIFLFLSCLFFLSNAVAQDSTAVRWNIASKKISHDDTIYRCGDTHSTCSDIIDECFTIFSFLDLISILPYETCIPLPISWFHLSTEAFSRGEDFFLRGERKGIIGREGFIPSWKLHDE